MSAWATQTKSFVVSYFYPANYYAEDTCPDGLNPLPDVFFKRDLKILGLPQAEVNAMFDKDYKIQINVVLYGAHETMLGSESWPKMSGFELSVGLDDEQIAALCTYVRSSWGNRAGPVDAAAVAKQR